MTIMLDVKKVGALQRCDSCSSPETVDRIPDWVSLSGMKQACDHSVPVWWRSVWVVLIIGGLGFSFYQIGCQVLYYRSKPISVRMSMEARVEMKFPPVTFCNFNPSRMSALESHGLTHLAPFLGDAKSSAMNTQRRSQSVGDDETNEWRDSGLDWEQVYRELAHQLNDMLLEVRVFFFFRTYECVDLLAVNNWSDVLFLVSSTAVWLVVCSSDILC